MGHPFEDEVQSVLELLHLGYLSAFVTIVKMLIPNLLTLEPLKSSSLLKIHLYPRDQQVFQ